MLENTYKQCKDCHKVYRASRKDDIKVRFKLIRKHYLQIIKSIENDRVTEFDRA